MAGGGRFFLFNEQMFTKYHLLKRSKTEYSSLISEAHSPVGRNTYTQIALTLLTMTVTGTPGAMRELEGRRNPGGLPGKEALFQT